MPAKRQEEHLDQSQVKLKEKRNKSRKEHTNSRLGRLLAHLIPPGLKHLVKLKLRPPDVRAQAGKLPHPGHLLVPVQVEGVRVPADRDFLQARVFVHLVRHPELVVADDFLVVDALPFRAADEVLRAEEGVAEDEGVGGLVLHWLGWWKKGGRRKAGNLTILRYSSAGMDSQILLRKER